MLRYTSAAMVLLAASSASAQRAAGDPQPGSPQRPAQTTEIKGADQNDIRDRNAGQTSTPLTPPTDVRRTPPQNVRPNAAQRQNREANFAPQTNEASTFDSLIADCLILGNQKEIALLKFGMDRTKNDEVQKLAKMMIDDHEKAVGNLRKFASPKFADFELTADQSRNSDQRKGGGRDVVITREARKVGDAASAGSADMSDKMQRLARRTAEQALILNREELSKYDGHEFDQAFLGQQLGAHIGMMAHLKAAGEETSSDLSQVIQNSHQATKGHKQKLEDMMNKLSEQAHGQKK